MANRRRPPRASSSVLVFGYGSLVALDAASGATLARLPGFRRTFGVAMDNRRAIPGYKVYADPDGGDPRPAVYVAFLDLEEDAGSSVNGTLSAVSPTELEALDARERNYDRVEVSDPIDGEARGRTFAYRGSAAGRARLARGRAEGTAVVARDYLEGVRRAFAALGPEQERAFLASTELDALPVRELERVELPA